MEVIKDNIPSRMLSLQYHMKTVFNNNFSVHYFSQKTWIKITEFDPIIRQ